MANTDPNSYNGNQYVKRDGVDQQYTEHELEEYIRCSEDASYFIENYVKVISLDKGLTEFKLYGYQKTMVKHLNDNRFSIILACRQSGKCSIGDTIVEIGFLDSDIISCSLKIVHEIFGTLAMQQKSLKYKYIYDEQILNDLFPVDGKAKDAFSFIWRGASYSAKVAWWAKFQRQSSDANLEGTLSSTLAFNENVSAWDGRARCYDVCLSNDDSNKEWPESQIVKDVSKFTSNIQGLFVDFDERGAKSVLWEKTSNSSKGDVRENTLSRSADKNSRGFIKSLEGRIIPEEGIKPKDKLGRDNRKTNIRRPQEGHFTRAYQQIREWFHSPKSWEGVFRVTQGEVARGGSQSTDSDLSSLQKTWEGTKYDPLPFRQLQTEGHEKFIESFEGFGLYVNTDSGKQPLIQSHKTIDFHVYEITTSGGKMLRCADLHILFRADGSEVFIKDLVSGDQIQTQSGLESITSIVDLGYEEEMYDLGVNSVDHRFFTNGILSHNSVTSVAWLLWYVCFHKDKKVGILANKGATAREMLSRLTLMLENLPFFLQPGCKELNKGSIKFSNNSNIIAAATSSSSIRGLAVNVIFLDEFAFVNDASTFYTSTYPVISSGKDTKVIITSTPNGIGNIFYKLWEGAVQGNNEFKPFTIKWWDVPGRDEAWKKQTIANTSELQFSQEFSCLGGNSKVSVFINNREVEIKLENLHETYPLSNNTR